MSRADVAAVIVAAGRGSRMGGLVNKVLLPLGGRSLLIRSLEVFTASPLLGQIVVVIAAEEQEQIKQEVASIGRDADRIRLIAGGATRHISEGRGIGALSVAISAGDIQVVLVHDAARPFVTSRDIERVVEGVGQYGAVVPALPVEGENLMAVTSRGEFASAPKGLWAIQTPQGFSAKLILEAHQLARRTGFVGVDTAAVAEHAGHPVHAVEGSRRNFKITTPEDLLLAEALWKSGSDPHRLQL
ncbi:MAG: 2-C-methyl-D-erythritol 4-phosphate cytidylyltransferase [Candidatus Dormibacteraceae bacterium]